MTGAGVIISVFDRGIDYTHPDFRNDDGTTRILYLLDLSDNTGANDSDNPLGAGTVYTKSEIDASLDGGSPLATRDAVGHGTLTAGIAGGNGRASGGTWTGVAPEATFIIVKFTSEGAPAHDNQPAEAAFYAEAQLGPALDFVLDKAAEHGMPVVVTANFGSIQGPSDGTSSFARIIDERFGPGREGRIYVSGSSDDGGRDNHASGTVAVGTTVDLKIRKGHAGNLRVDLWYDEADRFDLEFITPSASFGPHAAVPTPNGATNESGAGFVLYQRGRDVDFFSSTSNNREVLVDISGAPGDYILRITGAQIASGEFHALMNPSNIFSAPENRFETFVVPGYTIWDGASSANTIVPNSYVHAPTYVDINGVTRTYPGNNVGAGALWPGSGVGPTLDGRTGITVSAPGNNNIGAVPPTSYFASLPSAMAQGGEGNYGILAFVSGANPVLSGTIALMLEQNPSLDAAEMAELLMSTAREDSFTGTTPNPQWGAGKLDAFAAVQAAGMITSNEHASVTGQSSNEVGVFVESVFPNPAGPNMDVRWSSNDVESIVLSVYDVLGRRILQRSPREVGPGSHETSIDTSMLSPGLYYLHLRGSRSTSSASFVVNRNR